MPQALYPSPKTTVPLVITATRFPLAVYLYTLFMSCDFKQGSATQENKLMINPFVYISL
jgi:hypothetical protein